MSLSPRAQAYLATLRRAEHVPVDDVSEALKRAGCPVFDAWLDFHARYAGYEEIMGHDLALWGLVHRDPEWLDPGEVSVERKKATWRVVCADVHPSYDYWLDSNGEFDSLGGGGCCETFDVKVERNAMFWEATKRVQSWTLDLDLPKVAGGVDELCRLLDADIVPEASDRYTTCWRSNDLVIIVAGEGATTVWIPADRRESVLSRVGSRGST